MKSSENEFVTKLGINANTQDLQLDDFFLTPEFNKLELIGSALSVTNLEDSEDQNSKLRHLEAAQHRLRTYLDTLREQIVAIVETESEGFLRVAAKLDGFKQLLSDMKQAAVGFNENFNAERLKTE